MNDHEAQRIAAAMHELRPDWPASSLLTLIRKNLIDKPRRDVTVALAWVACESGTHTPARVLESGPWWRAAGVEVTRTAEKWDDRDRCTVCSKTKAECDRLPKVGGHIFLSRAQQREYAAQSTADTTQRVEALRAAVTTDLRALMPALTEEEA